MFFQEVTPDTSSYMIAGFAITFLVLAAYVASLYLRDRNLKQDIDTLTELQKAAEAENLKMDKKRAPKKNAEK
ncbi:MAG: hypothetical protein OZ914_02380 [Anaerolineaceae bacterium]|jgi:hypothetical protein|nr:hypothetical protein [Anaerolineales bacterium]MCL4259989.1 hypothetical protein [Anaerolineales bacterium]MEB2333143.1 hypothetical protein [Anaerolineaceae bacterium]OQY90761.1 MAG: hypothetical protein B6D38_03235 [Anaerolineae bacterium UTCFX1]